jgi:tetratricopeptide (TPR) repeat protein
VAEAPTEGPSGYQDIPDDQRRKAETFFARGKTVADTGQFDYSIEMYLQGLKIDPEAVDAHKELRTISLKRKASGGKALGMLERMKLLRAGKDHRDTMLNAEKVMSYNPGDMDAMEALIVAANKGGFWDTVLWIGQILETANVENPKPDVKKFIVLKDVYKDLKQWQLAVRACQYACQLRPQDMDLAAEAKNLGVEETMQKGNYNSAKSFRDSVRDKDAQQQFLEADRDVRSQTYMDRKILEAESQYNADPNEPGKLIKLVEALESTDQMEYENKAIELLQGWYERTKQFRFRRRIGQINIKMWNRMVRAKREELRLKPTDEQLKKEFEQLRTDQLQFELKEYAEWAENYPTEMLLRFEQAKRLYQLRRFDEAIPVLQQAASDPKIKLDASTLLGKSFYEAGFYDEAAQILESAINDLPTRNDDRSKDMFYWRARALEQIGDADGAIKLYSQLAQWQFNYLDVQQRIKKLRDERGGRK